MAIEKRDKLACVKVKKSELEAIKLAANKENKTFSEFMRDTLMNKVRRVNK